jgi:hypothetical protein
MVKVPSRFQMPPAALALADRDLGRAARLILL